MKRQQILFASFWVILSIGIINFLGCKYYLYWTYRWLDIPVHIVAGAGVALATLWFLTFFERFLTINRYKTKILFAVLVVILFVGIIWELFELWGGITYLDDHGYRFDTIKDLVDDTIGAMIVYGFFIKRKKCKVGLDCLPDIKDKKI